ncbi:hypothetical protein ES708_07069 [subsurface metagenome]
MPGLITGKITLQQFAGERYVDIEECKGEKYLVAYCRGYLKVPYSESKGSILSEVLMAKGR